LKLENSTGIKSEIRYRFYSLREIKHC